MAGSNSLTLVWTMPHSTFTVVAHNTLVAIWTDPSQMADTIHSIEQANNNIGALDFAIANLL